MIIDSNNLDQKSIQTDICVVGSGPSAFSFVKNFLDTNYTVSIVESGNFSFDQEVNLLNNGQLDMFGNFPHQDYMLKSARVRMIGGTSNVWAGWSGPLLKEDFNYKQWIPKSGWEIEYDDLQHYYLDAQKLLGLSKFIYDENLFNYYPKKTNINKLEIFNHSFWQFSDPPINFKKKFKKEIGESNNINLYYNCTGSIFAKGSNDTIENLKAFNSKKDKISFNSKYFIVACGGIENATLLLNSKQSIEALNKNKNIGNYFFEHPHVTLAKGETSNFNFLETYKKQKLKKLDNIQSLVGFSLKKEDRIINQISNCINVVSNHNLLDVESAVIIRHMMALKSSIISKTKLINIFFRNFPYLLEAFKLITKNTIIKNKIFYIISRLEQQPIYENRIYLSKERNKYGNFLPKINWQLSDLDYRTLKINYKTIYNYFNLTKVAKIRPSYFIESLDKQIKKDVFAVGHHMGTTRMSKDMSTGVVNRNLRVHNLNNLFVAGSSTFPTGGFINPTMTVIALSLRLGNHIKELLEK